LSFSSIRDRYVDHALGAAWAVIGPLLQIGLYLYLFTVVFPARMAGDEVGLKGLVWLLSGLVAWFFIADAISRAVGIVAQSPSLVQRVLFPVEVLPAVAMLNAMPNLIVGLAFLAPLALVAHHGPYVGLLLLPPALVLMAVIVLGLGYLLAALGPFKRDLAEVVQFAGAIGLFLAPVLYLPETVERLNPALATLLQFNPFTHLLACFRDALVFGAVTAPWSWFGSTIFALLTIALGLPAFARVKPHFAEAL
jgi:lipopolysaccharide transport system permease protein